MRKWYSAYCHRPDDGGKISPFDDFQSALEFIAGQVELTEHNVLICEVTICEEPDGCSDFVIAYLPDCCWDEEDEERCDDLGVKYEMRTTDNGGAQSDFNFGHVWGGRTAVLEVLEQGEFDDYKLVLGEP